MKKLCLLFTTLLVVLLSSCGGRTVFSPQSSGRPYEVLVVIDSDMWEKPSGRALFDVLDTNVPGLPQPERSFRISNTDPRNFNQTFRIFRNIIIVKIDSERYTQPKMKYQRDVYAVPQVIMTIQAPDKASFAKYVKKNSDRIVRFFTSVEMNREVKNLEKKHSAIVERKVDSLFGCSIYMPADIHRYKAAKDFLWCSTDRASADLNFVMYSYPYTDKRSFTLDFFVHKRDSVMKANIPGQLDGMWMTTNPDFVWDRAFELGGEYAMEVRGLWEMRNDCMGGPFVSHVRYDRPNGRIVVVEGFVYSPDKLKRNYMRLLEAALYTLRLPREQALPELVIQPDSEIQYEKTDSAELSKKI